MQKPAFVSFPAILSGQKELADLGVGIGQPEVVVDHLHVVGPEMEVVLNGLEVGRQRVPLGRGLS